MFLHYSLSCQGIGHTSTCFSKLNYLRNYLYLAYGHDMKKYTLTTAHLKKQNDNYEAKKAPIFGIVDIQKFWCLVDVTDRQLLYQVFFFFFFFLFPFFLLFLIFLV